MEETKKLPEYEIVDGMRITNLLSHDAFRSAVAYKPRANDLFIVTYPKCGTTWTQSIVLHILRRGRPLQSPADFFQASPYLEMTGADAVDMMLQPGVIKMHVPFNLVPYSPEAKYIYVVRNPKDVVVSFYHHTRTLSVYNFENGDFNDFFDIFIKGEVEFGDFFDHLLSWYEHINDPNVLFLTYENMKKDTKKAIYQIAEFVGEEYRNMLDESPDILENILRYTNIEYMKETINKFTEQFWNGQLHEDAPLPSGIKAFLAKYKNIPDKKPVKGFLVRKGIVGDWENYLTPEQEKRIEEWTKLKTAGSDVMKIWN